MANSKEIIDAVSRAVKDNSFQKRDSDTFAQIVTDAQDYIVDQLECLIKTDSSIDLVADTLEYDLPSDFIKFDIRTSNNPYGYVSIGDDGEVPLFPVNLSLLDTYEPNWRSTSAGTPKNFYLNGDGKIGIYPKPSSTFITAYGNTVRIRYVYRPSAMTYSITSYPFGSDNVRLRGIQYLIKLHSIWQISLEDTDLDKSDRFDLMLEKRMEIAKDFINSNIIIPSAVGFTPQGLRIP